MGLDHTDMYEKHRFTSVPYFIYSRRSRWLWFVVGSSLDRWVDAGRLLENMKVDDKLADPFKITALEQLMNVGQTPF